MNIASEYLFIRAELQPATPGSEPKIKLDHIRIVSTAEQVRKMGSLVLPLQNPSAPHAEEVVKL